MPESEHLSSSDALYSPSILFLEVAWTGGTHDIFNQVPEHSNCNLLASDVALTEALDRTAAWSFEQLTAFGGRLGREETFALADAANRNPPVFNAFDARGHRIDSVELRRHHIEGSRTRGGESLRPTS
jgi:hypothetical protein